MGVELVLYEWRGSPVEIAHADVTLQRWDRIHHDQGNNIYYHKGCPLDVAQDFKLQDLGIVGKNSNELRGPLPNITWTRHRVCVIPPKYSGRRRVCPHCGQRITIYNADFQIGDILVAMAGDWEVFSKSWRITDYFHWRDDEAIKTANRHIGSFVRHQSEFLQEWSWKDATPPSRASKRHACVKGNPTTAELREQRASYTTAELRKMKGPLVKAELQARKETLQRLDAASKREN